jgi:hypothetical protein
MNNNKQQDKCEIGYGCGRACINNDKDCHQGGLGGNFSKIGDGYLELALAEIGKKHLAKQKYKGQAERYGQALAKSKINNLKNDYRILKYKFIFEGHNKNSQRNKLNKIKILKLYLGIFI